MPTVGRLTGSPSGWGAVLGLLVTLHTWPSAAQQAGRSVVERGLLSEDSYVAGARVDILADVEGDVIAAGGRVTIGRRVSGDVAAAGGDVTISGEVVDDARVAGGVVTITSQVGGDVIVAGGSVNLPPEAVVAGKAWLFGGDVEIRGHIGQWLRVAASTIRLAGQIDGDVSLVARRIEILPGARIAGNVTYRSPGEATIDPAAQIRGTVTHHRTELPEVGGTLRTIAWVGRAVFFVSLTLAGIALVLLFPGFSVSAARTIGSNPWKSLGVGFALLVAAPAAGTVLMMTVLGFALGLTVWLLYSASLLIGLLTGVLFLGILGVRPLCREVSKGWAVLAMALAWIVLGLLQAVPVVGVMILFLAVLFGLGAFSIHGYRTYTATGP